MPWAAIHEQRSDGLRAWLADIATTLRAPHLEAFALVAIDQPTGQIVEATRAARALLGEPLAASVAELVERGTIAAPDAARVLAGDDPGHQRGHGPGGIEQARTWRDQVRIHRDGASTVVQVQVLHHHRPLLDGDLAMVTLTVPAAAEDAAEHTAQTPPATELWSVLDGQGRIVALEPGWDRVWAEPDRLLGTLVSMLCHPDDVTELMPIARDLYSGRIASAHYTVRIAADDGRWVPVQLTQRTMRTATGDLLVVSTNRFVEGSRQVILPGQLTRREAEVVSALFDGDRVGAIAERHGVSVHTVRNQLRSVYRKLDASGQADLLARFHRPTTA